MAFALMCIVYDIVRTKRTKKAHLAIRSIDFNTLFLLAGLFVVIQGIEEAGVIDDIAGAIAKLGGGSTFILYTVIVWGSVLISAFVDNIPYVATMLPVITTISAALGIEPYLLYFGLLCGATLGGNLTPVGASANITAVGMLRQFGHEVSVKDFMRIGVPFTLAAVTAGYLFIWIVWH
jgi:Na+/H+ antiporter NhaD/arsenite permease-like protein